MDSCGVASGWPWAVALLVPLPQRQDFLRPPQRWKLPLPPLPSLLSVLPKFELLIDPPQYIRDLDVCEKGSVQAR